MRTGVVTDSRFMDHRPADGHPENHLRLSSIYPMLTERIASGDLIEIAPRQATLKELFWIHSPGYVDQIAATAGLASTSLTPDTHASSGSFTAALLAAGGLFEALSQVVAGSLDNAMILARPPGHHAEKNRAMGFCLFNTVALGACFARSSLGCERVLIVDWDVHHGNGTQHAFEADDRVLFFSTHQYPLFPGTGTFTETGRAKGEGFTINLPLPRGYGDGEFLVIYQQLLRPVALAFNPDIILVSAGFDCHKSDPIGGMRMTSAGFAALTRSLLDLADTCCQGRLVMCLEGGYDLKALQRSVQAVLDELRGHTRSPIEKFITAADSQKTAYALKRSRHVHQVHWPVLAAAPKNTYP